MSTGTRAARLNRDCACESTASGFLSGFHSHVPVFIEAAQVRAIESVVAAVHAVTQLPGYQQAVLADAPAIARLPQPTAGVFAGFDFHITADGPQLIEINTNAGGAMINAAAGWRHPDCCAGRSDIRTPPMRAELEQRFVAMFEREWRQARGDRPLRTLAIVDDDPTRQFLFPEFQLFAALFEKRGIEAFIADAAQLEASDGALRYQGRGIDLVYNRVTDFYFAEPAHHALRVAVEQDLALITPHPRAHALLADKRNLVRLTDRAFLEAAGATGSDVAALTAHIPLTRVVLGNEEDWWRERKQWFFKPAHGFGSRGAYRGEKITRRVFAEVCRSDYVAQRVAAPGERRQPQGGSFKVDIRAYAHEGQVQLLAARLYQGQTTNFRTVGGGFAPVLELT